MHFTAYFPVLVNDFPVLVNDNMLFIQDINIIQWLQGRPWRGGLPYVHIYI